MTNTARIYKHIDFTGFVVVPRDCEGIELPVVYCDGPQICEICEDAGSWENPNDQAAIYTIDAKSELGDGGVNNHYCQKHMEFVVGIGGYSGDIWRIKEGN